MPMVSSKKTHVSQKQPHDSSDSNPIESHDSSDENIKNKEKMPSFIL